MIERGTKRCGLNEIVVFLGALGGGTLCSLTSKIMLSMQGRGLSGRIEAFSSPLFQTFAMFLSLNLALVIHFASIYFKIPLPGQENEVDHDHDDKKSKSIKKSQMITYILLICPTIFDIAATCLAMAGLMYVSVSIYQILRGSCIIFIALIKQFWLNQKLYKFKWVGIMLNVLSIVLVGFAAFLSSHYSTEADAGNALFGVALILLASFVQSLQYVVEEYVMCHAPEPISPMLLTGIEGLWLKTYNRYSSRQTNKKLKNPQKNHLGPAPGRCGR